MPDENEEFDTEGIEDLFNKDPDLQYIVGDGEVYLRKQLGNDRFDKLIAFQDVSATNSIAFDEANVRRMNGIADAWENLNKLADWFLGRFSK